MSHRPSLFVLAGVNGAGKSSVGGAVIRQAGATWYNPDDFARLLVVRHRYPQQRANVEAWRENLRRIDQALASSTDYAFETTLGGNSIPARILAATRTHDVYLWYCGLASSEQHLARVKARVAQGGHDIPEERIRQRFVRSPQNLINLMPSLTALQVYDNSADVAVGEAVPDPALLLEMRKGRITYPDVQDVGLLHATPEWTKPLLEAAIRLSADDRPY